MSSVAVPSRRTRGGTGATGTRGSAIASDTAVPAALSVAPGIAGIRRVDTVLAVSPGTA
jgi:hypothetical protein